MSGRNNPPNLLNSESGSSCRRGTLPTGESIPRTDAAALIRPETPSIDGRSARSACQQPSSRLQTSSERPSSNAFAGFVGFSPSMILSTNSDPDTSPNGSVPVSTYTGKMNICVRWEVCSTYLVDYHCNRVRVGFLRRQALVQPESGWNKKFRCHERSRPSAYCGARRVHP